MAFDQSQPIISCPLMSTIFPSGLSTGSARSIIPATSTTERLRTLLGYVGVRDGTHAKHHSGSGVVSGAAIAASLPLDDVARRERLVAFALASFANRDQPAWPAVLPLAETRATERPSRMNPLLWRVMRLLWDHGGL